jgi:predicted ATPase/DNA-binding CsgD family transcriptional regulator
VAINQAMVMMRIVGGSAGSAGLGKLHGFPRSLTSYVGRATETARVAALLGESRLVTVTGPGGVGKTRLASEVARQVAGRFADGAWLVELAQVADPELVAAAVAIALGVGQAGDQPTAATISAALGRQQLLLVLDNCEHVLGAVADVCGSLLAVADDLTVLATSRQPAGVAGETRYRLRPLPVETADGADREAGAVLLFADRARQVDPDFRLDETTAALSRRLVARLDGMPLAIELAAARIEVLGLGQLVQRVEGSFALLAGANRASAPRHRSLAAAVEWSYQLLDEPARRVFRRLSVFPASFTLDGAVAVAGEQAELAVLHLVDCSLLIPPRTGPDGRDRYLMLETLRAYGSEQLTQAGEQPEAAAALAGYALRVARQAAAVQDSAAGELDAARWLDAEDAMVHASLTWCLEHDPPTALPLAMALAPWWRLRGRRGAAYELLRAASDHAEAGGDEWCAAQVWLGELSSGASHLTGLEHFTAAREVLAARPPSTLLARALSGRGACLANLGRTTEAGDDIREALAMSRRQGYPAWEANALYWLAGLAYYAGDQAAMLGFLQQTRLIDPAAVPPRIARICNLGLTIALTEAGDYAQAREICGQALAATREAGDLVSQAECLAHLADIDLRTGRAGEAAAQLGEALDLALRTGHQPMISDCLDYCGHLCAMRQQWDEALTLWAAFAAGQQRSGLPDPPQDAERRQQPAQRAERELGAARAHTARERGSAMSLPTAAEFAMLQATAPPRPGQTGPAEPAGPQLSMRERELVALVAAGNTDAQIAGTLFISISTVRSHLERIRDKTSCRRRADLTRLALKIGLA